MNSNNPDEMLIAACGAFTDIATLCEAIVTAGASSLRIEKFTDVALAPLMAQRDDVLKQILSTPAVTIEGIRAKARVAAVYEPELVIPENYDDFEKVAIAILRDLIGASPLSAPVGETAGAD